MNGRRVPCHNPGYGVTDNQKPRNPRLSDPHTVRGRQAQYPARSDRESPGHSCERPLRIPGPCCGLPTPQCPRPLRQCFTAHARSGGAREMQASLRHLHVVSTSTKRWLQPGGTGALCVRVHERAPVSRRTRRGLHQLHRGQARNGEGSCHRNRTAMSPVPHQRSPRSARPRPRDEYVGRDPGNHSCKPQHCT